jgi:hypothetical protein
MHTHSARGSDLLDVVLVMSVIMRKASIPDSRSEGRRDGQLTTNNRCAEIERQKITRTEPENQSIKVFDLKELH